MDKINPDWLVPPPDAGSPPSAARHIDLVFDDSVSLTDEATVEEVERDLDLGSGLLGVMQSMLDLMESERRRTVEGAFFGVVVSLRAIVAGVAPLVEQSSAARLRTLLASSFVAIVALAVYLVVPLPSSPVGRIIFVC